MIEVVLWRRHHKLKSWAISELLWFELVLSLRIQNHIKVDHDFDRLKLLGQFFLFTCYRTLNITFCPSYVPSSTSFFSWAPCIILNIFQASRIIGTVISERKYTRFSRSCLWRGPAHPLTCKVKVFGSNSVPYIGSKIINMNYWLEVWHAELQLPQALGCPIASKSVGQQPCSVLQLGASPTWLSFVSFCGCSLMQPVWLTPMYSKGMMHGKGGQVLSKS